MQDNQLTFTVVDLETENKNVAGNAPIGRNPSYQWHPDNYILALGARTYTIDRATATLKPCTHWIERSFRISPPPSLAVLISNYMKDTASSHLVFHNAAFDLQWLMRNDLSGMLYLMFSHSSPVLRIWDTMLEAYMLSGNYHRMLSLSKLFDLCVKLDRVKINDDHDIGKDDLIKEYADKGLHVSDIPVDRLLKYLIKDLNTTAFCHATLLTGDLNDKLYRLMAYAHRSMLSTTWMAFNGMHYLKDASADMAQKIDSLSVTGIRSTAAKHLPKLFDSPGIEWLLSLDKAELPDSLTSFMTSNQRLAALLFGGRVTVGMRKPICDESGTPQVFKSGPRKGEVKTRKEPLELRFPKRLDPAGHKSELTAAGHYKIDETVLHGIMTTTSYSVSDYAEPIRAIVEEVLDYRKYTKITSTYLSKLPTLCAYDECIHPNIHHAVTATGRLSSSGPNLQNIASSASDLLKVAHAKTYFTSRFGWNGILVEADYSQLEVVIMAVLSKDFTLLSDLAAGIDIHRANAMELFGLKHESEVTAEQRRLAKSLSFQLQYGAGAPSMARELDIPESLAHKFIATYFKRYPRVKEWHDELIRTFHEKALSSKRDRHIITTPTGRRLTYFPTDRGGPPTTKLKNYPVQSVATADLVPIGISLVCTALQNTEAMAAGILPINTIHDSILLDVKEESLLPGVARLLRDTLVIDTAAIMRDLGVSIPEGLLKIDIKFGHTWGYMKPYNLDGEAT